MSNTEDFRPKARPVTVSFDPVPPPQPSSTDPAPYPAIQSRDKITDVTFPWQFSLLALLWILAGLYTLFHFNQRHPGPFPFLCFLPLLLLSPFLIISGRRQVRRWHAEDSAAAAPMTHPSSGPFVPSSLLGRARRIRRVDPLKFALTFFAAGTLLLLPILLDALPNSLLAGVGLLYAFGWRAARVYFRERLAHHPSLPWQHTAVTFIWLGALLALGLWYISSRPGTLPADVRDQLRPWTLVYLALTLLTTPALLLSARR